MCPHSLKGTAGNVAVEEGETAALVVAYLSHSKQATSDRHYLKPGALADKQQSAGLTIITGGK